MRKLECSQTPKNKSLPPSHNPHRIKKKLITFQGHDTFIYANAKCGGSLEKPLLTPFTRKIISP
jgi:hypothetical protein